jgi:DNA repair protein RadA/Sms
MARVQTSYVCQGCGSAQSKWAGQCEGCGDWNTLNEETASAPLGTQATVKRSGRTSRLELVDLGAHSPDPARMKSGIEEFDRVCGGGFVQGSAILVGGDPGIGKSTLLLQVMAKLADAKAKAIYISGEEAINQVRRRAKRLGLADSPVSLAAETSLDRILDGLKAEKPDIVVIDSIQTMWTDQLAAAPGTVTQVRACCQELVRYAKKRNCTILLVGHVTKDGQIAGPRVVEHMVDAVLYFEGERSHRFRILRAVKNRFGPTDEIGVFEMGERGLGEVTNPSALFLDGRRNAASGSVVFAGMEGTRPVLSEIQALVAPAAYGTARRSVLGWDSGRLAMVLAVLESRCGVNLSNKDIFLNVAGGLKISEPAADLAVAAAIVSSALDVSLPSTGVVYGEISLSGDVRPVGRSDSRLKEAAKLGFDQAIAPIASADETAHVRVNGIATALELVQSLNAIAGE